MSKMDRMLNSKKEKQTIYEIYRACRLCGAGAGYKMPIIQNVVDLDDTDVELKQKIRECVQIEVHQDDKMPPLICELCVDKVNDFYEFLEMCRQTNKRTRLRLGLPPQSMPGGAPDAGDCILGLTEPVYVNEDSDIESLSKHKKTGREYKSNVKIKKEPQVKVESRSSRFSKREPTPPRMLRNSRNSREDSSLSRSQERSSKPSPKVSSKAYPKSILKKTEDTSMLSPRLKRTRDKVPVKLETPVKKVKIATSPPTKSKSREVAAGKGKPSPPRAHTCSVCACSHKTPQALASHVKTHAPALTSRRLACDPCREWFPSAVAAAAHHRRHGGARPYRCQRCGADHRTLTAYDEHIANEECVPWPVVPDVKCESCWHMFATNNLLEGHRCLGEDHRPGGKCSKCNRNYALLKNLKKHESTCTAKKKGEAAIDPALLAKLKPIQVRVSRCDPLLRNAAREHYDVSSVAADFGLDKNCVYPYISSFSGLRIKSELDAFRGMVAINEEIKEEFCAEEYVHWDSEESDSDNDISLLPLTKQIDSLATLTLKTIFSRKCLGRVPRKRRRVKQEKIFDSLLNDTEDDVTRDINNIIDNLDNDDDFNDLDGIERSDFDDSGLKDKDKVLDTNGDQNDSNASKVCGDSKSLNNKNNDGTIIKNNDDTQNDECPKINSHDKDISLGDTLNNSDDKIDNDNEEKSQKENLTVDSSKITKVEIEGINKNDNGSQSSDAISDEHKINNNVREDSQNNNENSDGNSKNDDNSKECNDIVSNDSQKSKDTSDDHQMNDENSDEHINNDDNTDDVKEENKVTDDTKHNDAQINHEIANNQQNNKDISNDVTSDFQDNLDDSDLKKNLESTDGISKADTNDDGRANPDATDDGRANQYATGNGRANSDATVDGRANVDATDDILSKVDKSDDYRENVGENDDRQINDEIGKDSQKPDSNNDENSQLGELDSQDSNSVTFNESLLNDDLKNECVNEENKSKMAVNEHFSQDLNANGDPKSVDHEKINGDSINGQVFDNTDKIKSAEDIDDSKLMAALDAQIGECENSDVHDKATESYGFNDKIALEDLITDKNTTKPMDLDILPDEFNFDN